MKNLELAPTQEKAPRDISGEFAKGVTEFSQFLRTMRGEPLLHVTADLRALDKDAYVLQARRLKGFLESGRPIGQKRIARIIGTAEQRQWEANVLDSAVEFEEV